MRKPVKPTKKDKTVIMQKDILHNWDGKTAKELIVILTDCLLECENAEFTTEWSHDSTDCIVSGTINDNEFEARLAKYEEDMIAWRKFRIAKLQGEIDEIEGEVK